MSLVGTSLALGKQLHDVLLWEVGGQHAGEYTRSAIKYTNSSGNDVTIDIGTIIADATESDLVDTDLEPAWTDALTVARVTIPDSESRDIPVLVRGPAIINLDEIVRTSEEESDASVIARCDQLIAQGIRIVRHPANNEIPDLNG